MKYLLLSFNLSLTCEEAKSLPARNLYAMDQNL